jgi:hypothetical protein
MNTITIQSGTHVNTEKGEYTHIAKNETTTVCGKAITDAPEILQRMGIDCKVCKKGR